MSSLPVSPGTKIFHSNINITQQKGFGRFNLVAYWKRKYKNKMEKGKYSGVGVDKIIRITPNYSDTGIRDNS